MSIAVLGVNHRTAPLEIRERFAHAAHEIPGALARVLSAGADGGVLLSTCNRTEFYLADPQEPVPEAVWALLGERLTGEHPAREYGYFERDRDAVRHLYRVSAGLDSMVLGESQIQGQVREAWEVSRGQAGPVMHRLFQSALLVGARVRSETKLGNGAASVPSAAVAVAGKIFGDLAGRSALILGRATWPSSPPNASSPKAHGSRWSRIARTSAPEPSPSSSTPGPSLSRRPGRTLRTPTSLSARQPRRTPS